MPPNNMKETFAIVLAALKRLFGSVLWTKYRNLLMGCLRGDIEGYSDAADDVLRGILNERDILATRILNEHLYNCTPLDQGRKGSPLHYFFVHHPQDEWTRCYVQLMETLGFGSCYSICDMAKKDPAMAHRELQTLLEQDSQMVQAEEDSLSAAFGRMGLTSGTQVDELMDALMNLGLGA